MNRQSEPAAEWLEVGDLTPWADNPRVNDHAVGQVAKSIERFGFAAPIVARRDGDGLEVVAGHTRLKAAHKLGLDRVPVRVLDLDPADARLLALADNRLGELADWSDDLGDLMQRLDDEGLDLEGLGWSDEELAALLAPEAVEADGTEDDVPEVQEEVHSQLGEVYELGPHRLVCGDCRDVVWPLWPTLIYDPPWDDRVLGAWTPPDTSSVLAFSDGARAGDVVARFGAPTWVFIWDCVSSWWTPNRPLRRGKICFWYGDLAEYDQEGAFYTPKSADPGPRTVRNTRGSYEYQPHPEGRRLSDVFSHPITQLHADNEHSHEKPNEWVRCLIANCTNGDVIEPFAGSGAGLIAAAQLDRTWFGAELNPRYCDVIRRRWTTWAKKHNQDPGAGALE